MKKIYVILLLSSASIGLFGQNFTKSIKSSIKDSENEVVIGATVKLFTSDDSIFVTGTSTDLFGKFSFTNLINNKYYFEITAISQKPFRSTNILISNATPEITLPTFFMVPANATQLNEVVIVAKRPLIEQDIDKTIVNVDAMISAATSNTLEVLERTPGVLIDANGNINLNGRSGVMVLIDGRSTYMSGQDLAAYLKSLPGGILDRLELMDNPPAKYDAGGGAIINIILKKNRSLGLTGNLILGASKGLKTRSYNSLNLNVNRQKINIFGNIGYSLDANSDEYISERKIFDNSNRLKTQLQLHNLSNYASKGIVSRIGMDINPTSKTTLGMQLFFQNRPKTEHSSFINTSYQVSENLNQSFNGSSNGIFDWHTKGANVNFNQKINGKGRELSGDLNYINYTTSGLRDFENFAENSNQLFNNKLDNQINIYNFKTDYVHPLAKGSSFEAGMKASYVKNDYDAIFENKEQNGNFIDYNKSNHFIYNENINAVYANYRKPISKKWSTQLGLRVENTNLLGELLPNQSIAGEKFTQNFTSIFPSVFLTYKLDSLNNHSININYARRVNRPNYQQFNPFLNFLDEYTYSQGNTDLKPFFLNNIRIRYQYKQFYSLNLGYDGADGILGDITIRRGDTFIKKPFNVGTGFRVGFDQNISLKPAKFWKSNVNMQFARFQINGKADGVSKESIFYTMRLNTNNQFDFGKGWTGEVTGIYNALDKFYPVSSLSKYFFYTSIQKKILGGKGSIKLSFDDPTHTNFSRERIADFQNTYQFSKSIYDTKRIGFAFTYRFGNELFARKRRHQDNAAQDEQNRVQ